MVLSESRGYILALVYAPTFIPLLFMTLPLASTLEIMTLYVAIYIVIIPTINGGWAEFSSSSMATL